MDVKKKRFSVVRCPNCRGRLRRMFDEWICEDCEFHQKDIKKVKHTYR